MSTLAPPSATTLRGRWLLARAAWFTIATLALGLCVASIPSYVFHVLELGQGDWMGSPVDAPAALVFALNLLGVLASITAVLVCLSLAVVLFRRRSDDWMVMFISSYLLEVLAAIPTFIETLADSDGACLWVRWR
jgi:ABC-type phosphate transport system permease subunit